MNPGNQQAIASARRLEPIVAERREKLKEEMLGRSAWLIDFVFLFIDVIFKIPYHCKNACSHFLSVD